MPSEQAEDRLEAARRVFATVPSQHELDRHGNDGIGLAIWACPHCNAALHTFEATAQATIQTRVEALEAALGEAANHMEAYGRGVELPGFWDFIPSARALTTTEQGGPDG